MVHTLRQSTQFFCIYVSSEGQGQLASCFVTWQAYVRRSSYLRAMKDFIFHCIIS